MTHPTLKPGWKTVKFGDLVSLNTDRIVNPVAAGIERYVGLEHIEPENLHIRSWGLVAEGTTFTNYFKPGQVLFGKRRAYQRKVAVADFEGVCSSDIYVFESKDPDLLLPELLPFICQSEGFYEYAVNTSAGSLSPRTNWKHLANYELYIPPLDEQRRIANLLWAVDDAIETKQNLQDKLLSIRDTIREKTYFPAIDKTVRLQDICDIRYGLGQPPRKSDNGIPIIRATNISKGKISENDLLLVNPKDLSQNRTIYLHVGDIILVRSGAYTGDSALITSKWENAVAGYDLVISPDNDKIHPVYLAEFLLHSRTVKTILAPMSARTAQPHLNATQAGSIRINLPSLEVQLEKVQIFDNLNYAISALQENLNSQKQLKRAFTNYLLSSD